MYQKIKVIVCMGMFMIGAFGLSAQTDTVVSNVPIVQEVQQGEIVISKSDLINFLEKIAKARKDKIEYELKKQYLENINLQYSQSAFGVNNLSTRAIAPLSSTTPLQSMSQNELIREIEVLNSRLDNIMGYATRGGGTTTFITDQGYGTESGYYPYQTQSPLVGGMPLVAPTANNSELRWRIDSLQNQVRLLSAPAIVVEKQDEISRLNREIDQAQDSLVLTSAALTPEAREIVRSYGTSQMQVFFPNDVSEVSATYLDEVQRAATVLRRNPQLGVVLKGFASPVGNAKYNYDLSMRRNEAVKRMLIDYGVFPDQISSVFYGEDKTSSVSEARRVDIKFIIK
jgi:outer membrane protein OmpA-like peptidoglycan-associated protein